MNRTEWFRDHAVWRTLQEIGPALDQALKECADNVDAAVIVARLKTVLAFSGKRLAATDPFLAPDDVVDGLTAKMGDIQSAVREFISSGDVSHLNTALAHSDAALKLLAHLNVPATPDDLVALKESAESYRLAADRVARESIEQVTAVRAEADALETRLAELVETSTQERERLLTIAGEFQTQFAAAQDTRQREHADAQAARDSRSQDALAAHAAVLDEQRSTFTQQLAEVTNASQTLLEEEKRRFDEMREQQRGGFADVSAKYTTELEQRAADLKSLLGDAATSQQKQLEQLRTEFAGGAQAIRDDILRRKEEIEALAGVIANTGMTSGYQTAAKEARLLGRIWQAVTVGSMLGFIWIAYQVFLPSIGNDFHWPAFAGRVFVALSVGVLAAYAGTQADRQQKAERHNRGLALELQAIGPFIATLPKDKQDEFLLKIGDRSFGRGESGTDDKSPTSAADVLISKDLRTLIIDLVKARTP